MRETLFNWLMHDIPSLCCLDLCAGTGALGFEALSRGAASVEMVDASGVVCTKLRENASDLSAENMVNVIQSDVLRYLKSVPQEPTFDLVFVDPPYSLENHNELMSELEKSGILKPSALVYTEFPSQQSESICIPANWQVIKEKRMGNVRFCLYLRDHGV
jgi:16S rRNA (guanine966-N2)-methyltransferase